MTSATNPKYTSIYNDQISVNQKYADYVSAYTAYIDCSNVNASNVIYNMTYTNDPANQRPITICTNPSNKDLLTSITQLKTKLATSPSDYLDSATDKTDNINASYNDLVNHRSNLDLKLQKLYNLQNSSPNIYQTQLDSTVYSGILWTVLATTLIYYVFIKL